MRHAVLSALFLLSAFLLSAAPGAAAWAGVEAVRPTADSTFVESVRPEVARIRGEGESSPGTLPAWRAVRRLYALRVERLTELAGIHPLYTVTGAATQDAVELEILTAMHGLSGAAVQADSVLPSQEEASLLAMVMRDAPPLGEKPTGFMVLGFTGLAIAATDSLVRAGSVTDLEAARLGLRLVSHATTLHVDAYSDPLLALGHDEFLTGAFLTRLQCPNDRSRYTTMGARTRLTGTDLYRVYDLVCPVDSTSLEIEFYQRMASRLYKMAPRQKIKKGVEGPSPHSGPDP
jgi:hypothetical protein